MWKCDKMTIKLDWIFLHLIKSHCKLHREKIELEMLSLDYWARIKGPKLGNQEARGTKAKWRLKISKETGVETIFMCNHNHHLITPLFSLHCNPNPSSDSLFFLIINEKRKRCTLDVLSYFLWPEKQVFRIP